MNFQIEPPADTTPMIATIVYRPDEYSFATIGETTPGFTSLLVDDLQLEVDAEGRVVGVWGMCPHTRWQRAVVAPPPAQPGIIRHQSASELLSGVSRSLFPRPKDYFLVFADPASGWVHTDCGKDVARAVRIFEGAILGFDKQSELAGLWLHPKNGLPPE
jgi:hypothetical protein